MNVQKQSLFSGDDEFDDDADAELEALGIKALSTETYSKQGNLDLTNLWIDN